MTEETTEELVEDPTEDSVLALSDEDFAKMSEPSNLGLDREINETESESTQEETDTEDDSSTDNDESTKSITSGEETAEEDREEKEETSTKEQSSEQEIDYKSEYEKLIQPFKANGTDIQVKNSEEIITLMQMGANYHKKMATLKPSLKIIKLLERNDLLDESKLGYLIDLSKKDPGAIQKLVTESGIDPLDIDTEASSNYTPKTPRISDAEMQLEAVLEEIQETPAYSRTLKVVTVDWDNDSRNVVAVNPQIISVINGHISSGIYDKVMSEVNRARSFGKLTGISDLDAYKQIGDIMNNQGLLNTQPITPVTPVNTNNSVQKQQADDKRNAQRKAAGAPTIKKNITSDKGDQSFLAMSDEEFNKLPLSAYSKV